MKKSNRYSVPAAVALAGIIAQPALAQDPEVEALITPISEISVGLGGVLDDKHHAGMYTGLDSGLYPLLNGYYVNRDNETGTWLRFQGWNLGLDSRDARLEYERQGDWGVVFEGRQTPRHNPYIVTSPMHGLGSDGNTLGVSRDISDELTVERLSGKIGLSKRFLENFEAKASYRQEKKSGARQWGVASGRFAAEPIDFRTDEVEGTLNYTGKQLQLSVGHLASFFVNDHKSLTVAGGTETALPLDNSAHQTFLSGGYSFTPDTRGTFKVSHGRAIQNESFYTATTFAGNTRDNLGGEVENTIIHVGLTSRPITNLTTTMRLRHEDREDKTPSVQYVTASGTTSGFNHLQSRTTNSGDFEAAYRLPMAVTAVGGIGYERWDRSAPSVRSANFRSDTEEMSYRGEVRRNLTEELGGSLAYIHSERRGSNFLTSADRIDPFTWMDRDRDKVKFTLDWAPNDRSSSQFIIQNSVDDYKSRNGYGAREGGSRFVSVDTTYKLKDDWDLTGWASMEDSWMDQRTRQANTAPNYDWEAHLRQRGKALGVSLRGALTDALKVGADVQRSWDVSEHEMLGLGTVSLNSLPEIKYRQLGFNTFLDYEFVPDQGVRFDYAYARIATNDWTWRNYTYTDGTQVRIATPDESHFIGFTYYQRW